MNAAAEKRVYKNTLFLTLRTALTIPIGFFSVRIALDLLGAADYGMANVLGSLTALAGVLTQCISGAAKRFLCYDLATDDVARTRRLFSMIRLFYWGSAFLLVALAEVFGVWMILTRIKLSSIGVSTALIYYQTVVATFAIGYVGGLYSSLLSAYEDMSVLAWVSLGESILNILLLLALYALGDMSLLIPYGCVSLLVTLASVSVYRFVCSRRFREVIRFVFHWDAALARNFFGFVSWQLMAGVSGSLYGIINNVLLNNFFTSVVNAAQGVANIVNGKISSFGFSFLSASQPQLIKLYAQGDIEGLQRLFLRVTKFCIFVFLLLGLPIVVNIEWILKVWLKNPPAYASSFVILGYVLAFVDVTCIPGNTVLDATGRIRGIQIVRATLPWVMLAAIYVALSHGAGPLGVPLAAIGNSIIMFGIRFAFIKRLIPKFSLKGFVWGMARQVGVPVVLSGAFAYLVRLNSLRSDRWDAVLLSGAAVMAVTLLFVSTLGLTATERKTCCLMLYEKIRAKCPFVARLKLK